MKKLLAAAALLALLWACQKSQQSNHTQSLLDQAKAYIEDHPLPEPDTTRDLPYTLSTLHKTIDWPYAYETLLSFGAAVIAPVIIQEPLSLQASGAAAAPAQMWLLLYQDSRKQWHVECVTRVPEATTPFRGTVRVTTWSGQFLKAYRFENNDTTLLTQSSIYQKSDLSKNQTDPNLAAATTPSACSETDWYACSSIGDGPTECTYAYTTEDCTPAPGSAATVPEPGAPGSGDYLSATSGSAGNGASQAQTIIPDTSITAHPIIACVYNHLMSPTLTHGLKSILSNFSGNQIYNVTFTVAPNLGIDGKTVYEGNNNFLITLNGDEADDPDYSRIWLASTFIHEAFHAQLRQRALATFGEANIAEWPTPIDDMTLAELETYFEAESKSTNIWQSVEHDWMVANIEQMATSLQEFVQTYYKTTYAQVGSSLTPYEALMFMGLEGSTFYQEQVTSLGLATTYQTLATDLNEGGKCQD